MPNPIKYTTGTETLALKKGNFYIGTGDVGKGPSDTTGFYQGVSPSAGGYVIYMNKSGVPGDLSYHNAANDSELISFTNNLAGQSYTTVNECLVYYASQTDKVVLNRDYEGIVTDGLVLNLDAGFTPSYPKNGTTWYNLGGTNNGTLTNGPTFSSSNGGTLVFDGVDDRGNIGYNDTDDVSICMFLKIDSTNTQGVLGRGNTTADNDGWTVWVWPNGSNLLRFFNANTNGYTPTFNSQPAMSFSTGEWFCASFTRDNTNQLIKTFKNGVIDDSESITGTPLKTNDPIRIGNLNSNFYFNGTIGIIQIYNRVLTDDEILQNFNAQKGRFGL